MNSAREKLESIDSIFKHTAFVRVKVAFKAIRALLVFVTFQWIFKKN